MTDTPTSALTLQIKCSNGTNFTIEVDSSTAVSELKQTLAQKTQIPAEQQRLIHAGHVLKDDRTLSSYSKRATNFSQNRCKK
jgi:ubiquilin